MADAQTGTRATPQTDFVIVTALTEERDAVLSKLPSYRQIPPSELDVRVYYSAEVPAIFPDDTTCIYSVVVLCLLSMGRVEAANATGDAIRQWNPRYVLMVGIAGGVASQGVALGDVLVSDQVVDYEVQKLTQDGPKVRYNVHRADPRLLGAAMSMSDAWRNRIALERPGKGDSVCHQGPIATGDKVIALTAVLDELRRDWPKLMGVEMEAGGVASAAFQSAKQPGFFMIRGVSDLADPNKEADSSLGWKAYSCDVAASFTVSLLQSGPITATAQPDQHKGEAQSGGVFKVPMPQAAAVPATTSEDAESLLDMAEQLRNLMTSRATGGFADNQEYVKLRRQLMTSTHVRTALPSFVRNCRSLDEFWGYIKPLHSTYQSRRLFILESFNKVLALLEATALYRTD